MSKSTSNSPFSLPVLLSFNELAWIVIFAMGLLCGSVLISSRDTENDLTNLNTQFRSYSNEIARAAQQKANDAGPDSLETRENERLRKERVLLEHRTDQLQELLKEGDVAKQEALGRLETTEAALKQQRRQLASIEEESRYLKSELQRWQQGTIHQELLGLKGHMTNVVILLDRSGSMGIGNRWQAALDVVNSWLRHLPVRRCAFLIFSDHCQSIPDRGMVSLEGPDGGEHRRAMIERLRGLKPSGNTDTFSAMQKAYEYPGVDTIIIFTDGAPYLPIGRIKATEFTERGGRLKYSPDLIHRILSLARSKRRVPVNTVGLGNFYENPVMSDFLIDLASETGGVFIGR